MKKITISITLAIICLVQLAPVSFAKKLITPTGTIDLSFIRSEKTLLEEIKAFSISPPEGAVPYYASLMAANVTRSAPRNESLPSTLPNTNTAPAPTNTSSISKPVVKAPDTTSIARGTLTIPAIELYDVVIAQSDINDETSWRNALKLGVAKSGTDPGKGHKTVIFGHSSRFSWDKESQVTFKDLHKLEIGDRVYVTYYDKEYVYEVYNKEIVSPNTPSVLQDFGWEEVVFFTCWPPDTDLERVIIYTKPVTA